MTVLYLTWESPYLGKTVFILRRGPGSTPNGKLITDFSLFKSCCLAHIKDYNSYVMLNKMYTIKIHNHVPCKVCACYHCSNYDEISWYLLSHFELCYLVRKVRHNSWTESWKQTCVTFYWALCELMASNTRGLTVLSTTIMLPTYEGI